MGREDSPSGMDAAAPGTSRAVTEATRGTVTAAERRRAHVEWTRRYINDLAQGIGQDSACPPACIAARGEDLPAPPEGLVLNKCPRSKPYDQPPRRRSSGGMSRRQAPRHRWQRITVHANGRETFRPATCPSSSALRSPAEGAFSPSHASVRPEPTWFFEAELASVLSARKSLRRDISVETPFLPWYLPGSPDAPIYAVLDTGASISIVGINHWVEWTTRCPALWNHLTVNPRALGKYLAVGGTTGGFIGVATNVPLFASPKEDRLVTVDFGIALASHPYVLLGIPFQKEHGFSIAHAPKSIEGAQEQATVVRFAAWTRTSGFKETEILETGGILRRKRWVEDGVFRSIDDAAEPEA